MLKFALADSAILTHKSDCLLLALPRVKKKAALSATAKAVDKALGGAIGARCRLGDFAGKRGEIVTLYPSSYPHQRVVLVGLGEGEEDAREGLDAAMNALAAGDAQSAVIALEHLSAALSHHAVVAAGRACYQFQRDGHFPGKGASLQKLTLLPPADFSAKHLKQAAAVAEGVQLTRHLAEQPPNICTPKFLADTAVALAKKNKLEATVLDEKRIKALRMGALLAVAQGSVHKPHLIALHHRGGKAGEAPIVLVGKGVTFDTGGISIKPAAAMDEMKFDMCGAAAVFGVMAACAKAKTPRHVVGIMPVCENMPSGNAVKPGDVVVAKNGKSIEVLNTDAEGRLILADALTYADTYKPAAVIDIATLTGACVIALGAHTSGLMGRDEGLLKQLTAAGDAVGDPCWRLPLGDKYQRQLKSDYADVANIGGRSAGTITAACFLSRFTDCARWAHLDIAGTAWNAKKRATGRPVPLLMKFLDTFARP